MVSKINAISLFGLDGFKVQVEVDIHQGLPAFHIIGLPDKALQEATFRVSSAIKNSGYKMPMGKILVNLSPADLVKTGTGFDFAIAIGILNASKQISGKFDDSIFWGELSLDGSAKNMCGSLVIAQVARNLKFKELFLPALTAQEAGNLAGIGIKPVKDLLQLSLHYKGIEILDNPITVPGNNRKLTEYNSDYIDVSNIKAQYIAKRALEISASGSHNLLMSGSPGAGKTMLSKAFASILPDLDFDDSLEVTKIHSIAGLLKRETPIISRSPFRAPHHTSSKISIIGGGSNLKPGEITLAHKGVLFLDEMNQFSTDTLESLRQPLEEKKVSLVRIKGSVLYPADFILIAAINPCKCGYYQDDKHPCICSPKDLANYKKKISGPILDRIDLKINIKSVGSILMNTKIEGEKSIVIKKRVEKCREFQKQRSLSLFGKYIPNSQLTQEQLLRTTSLKPKIKDIIERAIDKYYLSSRGIIRILRTARTIADMESKEQVSIEHISESLSYRFNGNE
jgi:magnesium chelatase family protein